MRNESIAIVGAGAIGQLYGSLFLAAGHDVRFLARRDAAVLARRGLEVHLSPSSHLEVTRHQALLRFGPDRFRVASRPEELGRPTPPDWIFVALKTTALDEAEQLIAPMTGPASRIVVLSNGLGVEERLARAFDPSRVYGLLCFVCVNRYEDATVHHLAFGQVAAGHLLDGSAERTALVELCARAGIACMAPSCLLEARWRKLVWNIPFNGLCVRYDVTTEGVVADPARRAEALELAREIVRVANADLEAHGLTPRIEVGWADEQLRRTDTMGPYAPSTLLDARGGRPLETDALFAEPLKRARALEVAAPALERLAEALAPRTM